jgi:hypothetical protein
MHHPLNAKFKTHILCSITFFFKNRAIYEIMWKDIGELDRPRLTVWHMCIACWIPKATNTHSEYVITYCLFTAVMVSQIHHSVKVYVHCLSFLI